MYDEFEYNEYDVNNINTESMSTIEMLIMMKEGKITTARCDIMLDDQYVFLDYDNKLAYSDSDNTAFLLALQHIHDRDWYEYNPIIKENNLVKGYILNYLCGAQEFEITESYFETSTFKNGKDIWVIFEDQRIKRYDENGVFVEDSFSWDLITTDKNTLIKEMERIKKDELEYYMKSLQTKVDKIEKQIRMIKND